MHCPRDSSKLSPYSSPDCCHWLRNLYFDQDSVRIPVILELVNLTMDGICAACCALTIGLPDTISSRGSQHQKDFITGYQLFWAINEVICFASACAFLMGCGKNRHLLSAKQLLSFLFCIQGRPDLCVCVSNLNKCNCKPCRVYALWKLSLKTIAIAFFFQPFYTVWWTRKMNCTSTVHFWAAHTVILNCGK